MSDIKEKIAKQLMGSKTGLLSSTLAERLTIEKSIINDALEEMRQIQDVKKGSKSGLDNYRWTMTDMGRLNYRVDESLLTQTEKTTIETPQAAPIVEESPLEQKQVTTTNVAESTVESEKQAKTSPFSPKKIRELGWKVTGCRLGDEAKVVAEWFEQNQPEPVIVAVGLSNCSKPLTLRESIQHCYDVANVTFGDCHSNHIQLAKWLKELEQLKSQQFQPNWDDAPADAVEYAVFEYYTTKEGKSSKGKTLHLEQRPKPTPQVEVGQIWSDGEIEYEVSSVGEDENGNQCVSFRKNVSLKDFLVKFERVS